MQSCLWKRQPARVKIVLNGGAFEIEGSEDFVNSYAATIASLSDILKNPAHHQEATGGKESNLNSGKQFTIFEPEVSSQDDNAPLASPDSFGELYYKVPKSTSKTDIVLLASYFVQSHKRRRHLHYP